MHRFCFISKKSDFDILKKECISMFPPLASIETRVKGLLRQMFDVFQILLNAIKQSIQTGKCFVRPNNVWSWSMA